MWGVKATVLYQVQLALLLGETALIKIHRCSIPSDSRRQVRELNDLWLTSAIFGFQSFPKEKNPLDSSNLFLSFYVFPPICLCQLFSLKTCVARRLYRANTPLSFYLLPLFLHAVDFWSRSLATKPLTFKRFELRAQTNIFALSVLKIRGRARTNTHPQKTRQLEKFWGHESFAIIRTAAKISPVN